MYKVIIKNDDFNIKVIDSDKKEKTINASIDIFNINSIKFAFICSLIFHCDDNDIYNTYYEICHGYGSIPKHTIKYVSKVKEDIFDFDNYNRDNIYNEELLMSNIKEIKKHLKNTKVDSITTYECEDEFGISVACLYHYIKYGHSLRKCECCNQYFISLKKKDEKYCVRLNNNKKTCREIMAHKSRIESQNKEPRRTERNVYNNLLKNASEDTLNRFMNEKAIKKEEYNNKKISLEEYITFLKSFNKHKKD